MNNSMILDVILTAFVLTYVLTGLAFMVKQKLGVSFVSSFDQAVIKGAWFFAFGSGLSFITVIYGNAPQGFI
ncbi:MAG: hypothetical protein R8K20_05080 [Gallionellaceae bacterium]